MIADLKRLSRQSDTALHIVLTTVSRTGDDLSVFIGVLEDGIATSLIDDLKVVEALLSRERVRIRTVRIDLITNAVAHLVIVVCLILRGRTERVASREVEHHDIIQLYLAQTLHTTIVPVGPIEIALALHHRQRMLGQWHRQRCLRDTRSIGYFRHKEVVACQQRFLQRTRWNHVVLEEELVDEVDGYEGKHQRIHPRHHEPDRSLSLLPPLPFDLLRDIDIEDERHHEQSPPRLHPIEEQQI